MPISEITYDDNFASMLENKVQVPSIQYVNVKSNQVKAVDTLALTKLWTISPDRAKNTVLKKTKCGIRMVANPQMPRQYPTNDQMLRYPRLTHPLFTDTMIAGTVSKRGNKNSRVYGTSFGLTRFPPMKLKSDDNETLSLLFKHDGVLPEMIMDNSKEQLSSDFCKKLREANCHHNMIEPQSPWSTATNMNIRELKR